MNIKHYKKQIIVCAIALCVGVGGGYYFFGTPAGTQQSVVTNQTKQTKPLTEARNTYVVQAAKKSGQAVVGITTCLLYTSPSPRDRSLSRMPSSA